jgi:hypothetical protein
LSLAQKLPEAVAPQLSRADEKRAAVADGRQLARSDAAADGVGAGAPELGHLLDSQQAL